MDEPEDIAERLVKQLTFVTELRKSREAGKDTSAGRAALRAWQRARLAHTHADLFGHPVFGKAASFFLSDIYGMGELAERDASVMRIVPIMTRLLPTAGLETVADAAELDALTESLDAAMVDVLGPEAATLDNRAYARAYRRVDRGADRERQILLIDHLGHALARLVHLPLIGATLRLMHRPARLMGFGQLQDILERGYAALRGVEELDKFLLLVRRRERRLMKALTAGDDSMLEWTGRTRRNGRR